MVTERTDTVVRVVGVTAVQRSAVPRNVAMVLHTVLMDASSVDVLVSSLTLLILLHT